MLLAATATGLVMAGPVQAQDATGLRGGLGGDIADQTANDPAPAYVPVSPGALPEPVAADQANALDDEDEAFGRQQAATGATAEQRETAVAPAEQTDETSTGTVREPTIDSLEDEPLDQGAERAQAIEGLDRLDDDDPYGAVGIRWGSFIIKPTLETGITATSNADSSAGGSAAVLSETTLRLNAASDWASNSAEINAFGTFRKTLSGEEVDDVRGAVDAALELELGNEYRARGTFTYAIAPESAASPVVVPDTVDEPLTQTVGGTLGLEKDVGKARFAVTGGISHDAYGDADLEGGGVLSQADRDSTLYTLALRTGYEISPSLTPFVEAEIGRNLYSQEVDDAGYRRSSDQMAFRGGLAFDRGEKLSGEIAAGWIREDFDDDRLEPLSTPSVAAGVLWSPLRGTNVRLGGSTTLEGATTAGESGSVLYATSLAIERQMRANLTGNAAFGAAWRDYVGNEGQETILNAEASLTWWLNRYAGITGRVRHESVSSNLPGRDSETDSIFLGLKLQR
ncbi:MAG: outer membrane beta-barrel protein [Hyphomicrobiales bacterium]|nr:outer membrane beta-barrel protein [Hyphomicrobiales bacterium]